MKQGRNGNVGEFRHMTTSFFSTCLIMIKSDSVQDSFWCNHKDVSNSITYEHLRQLPLNNEPRPYKQGFSQLEKNEVVMCLNSPTLPFLPCFITFCSTHSYTSYFYEIFDTCNYTQMQSTPMSCNVNKYLRCGRRRQYVRDILKVGIIIV